MLRERQAECRADPAVVQAETTLRRGLQPLAGAQITAISSRLPDDAQLLMAGR
jgi:hypothetical protein